jgi:hypothetical protein
MPGATAKNIRKADLAEDLGKLLLRHFCALAPISKADDFGIDTIATLLEIDKKNSLRELANKTFGIQFKAKSVREINFLKDYEYNWLLNLDYPYFVCSVDILNSSMQIYSLHLVNSMPSLNESCTGLIVTLDKIEPKTKKNEPLKLSLGEPVIDLSIKDIESPKALKKKQEILKKWILGEYENIKTRNIGFTKTYNWETNKMPEFNAVSKIFTNIENLKIYGESFDFLDASLFELKLFNKEKEIDKSIDEINKILLSKGIELFLINNTDFEAYRKKVNCT